MRSRFLLALGALLAVGCDRPGTAQGPGTETETVTLCRRDGTPLPGATVRQIAGTDWLERVRAGRDVVFDTCRTDRLGVCTFPSRSGAVWEAFAGDSLAAWSDQPRLVAAPAALWTGSASAGATMRLERTSVRAPIGSTGVWAILAPQGTFPTWRVEPGSATPAGTVVLDTSISAWDSTRSFGTTLSLMDPASPFRIEWSATVIEAPSGLRVAAPSIPVGIETADPECVGICPILVVTAGIGTSAGLSGRIRLGPYIAGVVGGAVLHVRMNSTAPFQALVRGQGRDSTTGSVLWMPNNVGFDPNWVVVRTPGGLDTLSLESTNLGTITVLDVQARDSTGVRISIRR